MLAGLFLVLGVLTKGPVVLIHAVCPIAFYPLWRDRRSSIPVGKFFSGIPLVLLVGCIPVAAWLGPALHQTGLDFAYNLIWRQAEGRISGSLERAHARPFYSTFCCCRWRCRRGRCPSTFGGRDRGSG